MNEWLERQPLSQLYGILLIVGVLVFSLVGRFVGWDWLATLWSANMFATSIVLSYVKKRKVDEKEDE